MKSKTSLLLCIFFLLFTSLQAKNIDIDQARKVAGNFLQKVRTQYSLGNSYKSVSLETPYIYEQSGATVFYAFNTDPGFIIISGDDAYTPVIGYSYEGSFDLETAPPHYRGFIQNYIDQIQYIRDNDLVADQDISTAWNELSADDYTASYAEREDRDVAPLISSVWNQGAPFNLLCPEDPAGPAGHVYVGCVATAMAQVMYYWRYPEVGTGSHCYWPPDDSYGEQCADFGETYYNWEGMKNSIDNGNPYPNAEFQYHCAVSVDMMFSPNGSGAYSFMVPERLAAYWGYTGAQYLEKDWYDQAEWITILKDELDLGYPMYYSGFSQSAGHAFVCDGYQGDNFHFNFGWSGSGDGYYSIYNVGGFSMGQACVKNYIPSDPAYPYHASGDVVITQKSGSFTDGSGPVADYANNQDATWLIDAQPLGDSITDITLYFHKFDLMEGDTLKIYDGATTDDILLGSCSGTTIPANIVSTGDKMLITFKTDGSGTSAGWYVEFVAHSSVFCNGLTEITEPSGTIDDGSGNYNYHENSYCKYRIIPPCANTILLTFNEFETEDDVDLVAIYDGTTEVGRFSGNEIPDPIIATSGSVFIAWYTNGNTNYSGWSLSYETDNIGIADNPAGQALNIFPNPLSDQATFVFSLENPSKVNLVVLNNMGQMVATVVDEFLETGSHQVTWDAEGISPGIYFYRLSTNGNQQSANGKIVVVR